MTRAPTILLVDDDLAIRSSLKFSLELEGYRVILFESAEALAEQTELPDDACLVLDYRLPGIDGLSLLALLRRRGATLPAVIITTAPSRYLRTRVLEAGAVLIEKPLLCDALSRAIGSLVQEVARAA